MANSIIEGMIGYLDFNVDLPFLPSPATPLTQH